MGDYDHNITIRGTDEKEKRYDLAVSGEFAHSGANNGTVQNDDKISGARARGHVATGVDSYKFTGELVSLRIDYGTSSAEILLDGKAIDPTEYPSKLLVVSSTDDSPAATYSFTVSGRLEGVSVGNASVNNSDKVQKKRATGMVSSGKDAYAFGGDLSWVSAEDGLRAAVNGEQQSISAASHPVEARSVSRDVGKLRSKVKSLKKKVSSKSASNGASGSVRVETEIPELGVVSRPLSTQTTRAYYVAPDGSFDANGTKDDPLCCLQAFLAACPERIQHDTEVHVANGHYDCGHIGPAIHSGLIALKGEAVLHVVGNEKDRSKVVHSHGYNLTVLGTKQQHFKIEGMEFHGLSQHCGPLKLVNVRIINNHAQSAAYAGKNVTLWAKDCVFGDGSDTYGFWTGNGITNVYLKGDSHVRAKQAAVSARGGSTYRAHRSVTFHANKKFEQESGTVCQHGKNVHHE